MRIAIASDHAAIELKADLAEWLIEEGHEVADLGPEPGQSVDYPDYGYRLAEIIAEGAVEFGIALCGSGIGISISANRHPQMAKSCVATFLDTEFADAGDPAGRHQRRVGKLGKPPFQPDHIETHQ